jgi:YHS domain-containing protein
VPLLFGLALATVTPPPSRAVTTERVVVDRHTGLALYGVDPVGYFTDGKPVPGRADFEYGYAGAIWRFDNEGNRAAFATDPEVYMPRYGGYDPVGVSRGRATPGFPALWVVFDQRLYLFYTAEARAAFIADPASVIASASARWSTVKSELAE